MASDPNKASLPSPSPSTQTPILSTSVSTSQQMRPGISIAVPLNNTRFLQNPPVGMPTINIPPRLISHPNPMEMLTLNPSLFSAAPGSAGGLNAGGLGGLGAGSFMVTSPASNLTSVSQMQTIPKSVVTPKRNDGSQAAKSDMPIDATSTAADDSQNSGLIDPSKLKVEDALQYLEEVKNVYGHKPKVYNDFLDIMKEFKSSHLDTAGVITRVAKLFHGRPELIVGFNSFLPSGYEIQIIQMNDELAQTLDVTEGEIVLRNPHFEWKRIDTKNGTLHDIFQKGGNVNTSTQGFIPSLTSTSGQMITTSNAGDGNLNAAVNLLGGLRLPIQHFIPGSSNDLARVVAGLNTQFMSQSDQQQITAPSTTNNLVDRVQILGEGNSSLAISPNLSGSGTPAFNNAIHYVNKIKRRFDLDSITYKRFLAILQEYEGKQNVAPEKKDANIEEKVYKEVASLFNQHSDLLEEFTTFMPETAPAHRAAMEAKAKQEALLAKVKVEPGLSSQSSQEDGKLVKRKRKYERKNPANPNSKLLKEDQKMVISQSVMSGEFGMGDQPKKSGRGGARRGAGRKSKKVKEEEERLRQEQLRRQMIEIEKQQSLGKPIDPALLIATSNGLMASVAGKKQRKQIPSTQSKAQRSKPRYLRIGFKVKKFRQPQEDLLLNVPTMQDITLYDSKEREDVMDFDTLALFSDLRKSMPTHLFRAIEISLQLVNRRFLDVEKFLESMQLLVQKSFPRYYSRLENWVRSQIPKETKPRAEKVVFEEPGRPSLIDIFESDNTDVDQEKDDDEAKDKEELGDGETKVFQLPKVDRTEFDYRLLQRYGGSYRVLPDDYPHPTCSGRKNLPFLAEILNDQYVSFPVFSEGSSFVITKKNTSEEVLAKIEEERYEMDMLLTTAHNAIVDLKWLQVKMSAMKPSELDRFQFKEARKHRLIVLKLYGDNGAIVLKSLQTDPQITVPMVLKRVEEKFTDWLKVRREMLDTWAELERRNVTRALDYTGVSQKLQDLKLLRARTLINEIEKNYDGQTVQDENEETAKSATKEDIERTSQLVYQFRDDIVGTMLADDVVFLILREIERMMLPKKVKRAIKDFVEDLHHAAYGYRAIDVLRYEYNKNGKDEARREKMHVEHDDTSPYIATGGVTYMEKENITKSQAHALKTIMSAGENSEPMLPIPWVDMTLAAINSSENSKHPFLLELSDESIQRSRYREKLRKYLTIKSNFRGVRKNGVLNEQTMSIVGSKNVYLFFRYFNMVMSQLSELYIKCERIIKDQDGESYIRAKQRLEHGQATLGDTHKLLRTRAQLPSNYYWISFLDRFLKMADGHIDVQQYEDDMRDLFFEKGQTVFSLAQILNHAAKQLNSIVQDEENHQVVSEFNKFKNSNLCNNEFLSGMRSYAALMQQSYSNLNCFLVYLQRGRLLAFTLLPSSVEEEPAPRVPETWNETIEMYVDEQLEESIRKEQIASKAAEEQRELLLSKLQEKMQLFTIASHAEYGRSKRTRHASGEDEKLAVLDDEDDEDEDEMEEKLRDKDKPMTGWASKYFIRYKGKRIEANTFLYQSRDAPSTSTDDIVKPRKYMHNLRAEKIIEAHHQHDTEARSKKFNEACERLTEQKNLQLTNEEQRVFNSKYSSSVVKSSHGRSEPPYYVYQVCRLEDSEIRDRRRPVWLTEDKSIRTDRRRSSSFRGKGGRKSSSNEMNKLRESSHTPISRKRQRSGVSDISGKEYEQMEFEFASKKDEMSNTKEDEKQVLQIRDTSGANEEVSGSEKEKAVGSEFKSHGSLESTKIQDNSMFDRKETRLEAPTILEGFQTSVNCNFRRRPFQKAGEATLGYSGDQTRGKTVTPEISEALSDEFSEQNIDNTEGKTESDESVGSGSVDKKVKEEDDSDNSKKRRLKDNESEAKSFSIKKNRSANEN